MADHAHGHTHGHDEGHGTHIVPIPVYLVVFASLMVLLVITLVAAHYDLDGWNIVIAVTIAVVKAAIIVLYFMHLRWSTSLVRVFAGAALFWLWILFVLVLCDYFSRQGGLMPGG